MAVRPQIDKPTVAQVHNTIRVVGRQLYENIEDFFPLFVGSKRADLLQPVGYGVGNFIGLGHGKLNCRSGRQAEADRLGRGNGGGRPCHKHRVKPQAPGNAKGEWIAHKRVASGISQAGD